MKTRVAFFLATSGHSGVDRLMSNLMLSTASRGYGVDQLKVGKHGPTPLVHDNVRVIDLRSDHVYSSLFAVASYLRRERPFVMLSDKDKVNRTAIFANAIAGRPSRLVLRSGTTISVDLAHRSALDRWSQRTSMRYLYRAASAVVTPSEAARADFVSFTGLRSDLVRALKSPLLPRSVFQRTEDPPHPWFLETEAPVILGAGELSARKDYATLIRAFARLRSRRRCRLIILGDGKERHALELLAAETGVAADVLLPGRQGNVFPYMAHARVFASSSRWEGFGNVLAEALACGTPVVSTDCGGARELLEADFRQNIVAVGDEAGLAMAIERWIDAPLDRKRWSHLAQGYEIETATTAYLEVLGLAPFAER